MSVKNWRCSNCELAVHSPQSVWASVALCCKTTANRATSVKRNCSMRCGASHLSDLVVRMVPLVAMSNHTVSLQIPIAA